ncbi:MAG: gamma-glutamyltransferase, partial [Marinicaulis sp.]|nr:gamma-glutamyltransferase [Marinicaulis sp.]
PVFGANGMAATAHPLASQIAIDILKQGGNAVDAAIAANATLGLMEPTGNGIGGDLFAIIWDPKSENLYGLNASGRAPAGRTLADMKEKLTALEVTDGSIPLGGSLPVTVPGAVDGWFEMHDRFGKLSMKKVLAPAIGYAANGFPVSPVIAYYWGFNFKRFGENLKYIEEFENAQSTYLIDGEAPEAGEIFKNPDLARTYKKIASKGRKAFYKGEIAETIDAYMDRIGGDLQYEDLVAHESVWTDPGCVSYKGHELCELPPNTQGYAALQMLNILKNVDLSQWERGSAEVMHYITEAKRLAFEDVAKFYADPEFAEAPLDWLLSEEYGAERFALINAEKAMTDVEPGDPAVEGDGDTTYLTVADKDGMMVSLIQSNYAGMGSGLVPDGLGFMLQNRGALFALEEGHANVYEPGKRPFHTIIPAFVMKDGAPFISFGLMGGSMQPQGHVQVLVNIVDYGMNLQEAGDATRLNHGGGRSPTAVNADPVGRLMIEPGISAESVEKLRAMGHNVVIEETGVPFGGYQAIRRDPETGVYEGATEMRKDGTVAAY